MDNWYSRLAGAVLALDVHRDLLWVREDSKKVDHAALVPVPVDEARAEVTAAA